MAVAVPVLTPVAVKDLGSETFPMQNAASIDYYGDSAKNQMAHFALNDYVQDRKLTQTSPVLEEYVSDPIKEKDPSKWLTKIYYYTSDKK
jgi:effector-binding domain-containing protein